MFILSLEVLVLVVCLLGIVCTVISSRSKKYGYSLPPGPRGLPFIGTINFSKGYLWDIYLTWGKEFASDIIYVNALRNDIIILNSYEAAVDLLEKRSLIYSDRPVTTFTMLTELCGLDWLFAFVRYGQQWRDGRKAYQHAFNHTVAEKYRPRESWEITKLLGRLLTDPVNYKRHVDTATGGLILSTAYGMEIHDENDRHLVAAEACMLAVNTALIPGTFLVDFFPPLKYVPRWFPGAGFKRQAQIWRKIVHFCLHSGWYSVKTAMSTDPQGAPDCVAKSLYESMVKTADDPEYMENVVRGAIATLFVAGSDTTTSTLMSFFLAMVLHPTIQQRAQHEIDRVCQDRLPEFVDFESLPYVHAILKEVLRWLPVAAITIPHASTQDDIYRQYRIPKGTTVIANNWAMLHDPARYPDPDTFNPERFLKHVGPCVADVGLDPAAFDPERIIFGFGRRACPGRYLAYDTLWIAIASVLAAFSIEKAVGADGQPITPSRECRSAFVVAPVPFPCKITPRSATHEELVRKAASQTPPFA